VPKGRRRCEEEIKFACGTIPKGKEEFLDLLEERIKNQLVL